MVPPPTCCGLRFSPEFLAAARLRRAGIRVAVDVSNERLGAKIRNARLTRVPYIGVIGAKEQEGRGLAVHVPPSAHDAPPRHGPSRSQGE